MTEPAGGLRDRRRRDVMELLAQARPPSLDPSPMDPARGRQEAANILAAGPAAPPGVSQPGAATGPAGTVPAAIPLAGRTPRRRRAALAGAGLTAAAAATAAAVVLATGGGPAGAPATAPPAVLTAAMVRHVASASALALATSGRAVTSYRTSQDGKLQVSGTDDITFAGKDWNDSLSQSFAASGSDPASSQHAVNRMVDGTFYLFTTGASGKQEWIRDTSAAGHPKVTAPDPRKLLAVLTPAAGFKVIGHVTVGGTRLTELQATDVRHLPQLDTLFRTLPGGHVMALTAWVDGHDVVRMMHATLKLTAAAPSWVVEHSHGRQVLVTPDKATAAYLRSALAKKRAAMAKRGIAHSGGDNVSVRFDPHLRVSSHRPVQLTTVSVTFSGIGQPQRITAPRHSVSSFLRG
jgi:hypothetical protein